MGLYDGFYDEDSKCPKCNSKVRTEWLTKQFESLMDSWQKGDFVQYHKYEIIPEEEQKKLYGEMKFGPMSRRTSKYLSDTPLILDGKVPVHTSCRKCKSSLEAYAKVVMGRFKGITEIEADGERKEFVIFRPETTAKSLREEFANRLSQLQESCKHRNTKWMNIEWAPGHISGRARICTKCEIILNNEGNRSGMKRPVKLSDVAGSRTISKEDWQKAQTVLGKRRC